MPLSILQAFCPGSGLSQQLNSKGLTPSVISALRCSIKRLKPILPVDLVGEAEGRHRDPPHMPRWPPWPRPFLDSKVNRLRIPLFALDDHALFVKHIKGLTLHTKK